MDFPTLGEVSSRFTLNKMQHIAFCIAGKALLEAFSRSLRDSAPGKPLRMYIGGEGGTGKSRIVAALRYLAKHWGRPNAVQTVAPTGIAAVLIEGETAHSLLQLMTSRPLKPTMEQLEYFSTVHMLVWDEISMCSKKLVAKAFHNLLTLLGNATQKTPRIHIMTLGDFYQQPPIQAQYIFEPPSLTYSDDLGTGKRQKKNNNLALETEGYLIWKEFTTVIMLEENMRHRKDPQYGSLMRKLRAGNLSPKDL